MTDDIVIIQDAGDELMEIMSPTDVSNTPYRLLGLRVMELEVVHADDGATGGAYRCAPLTVEEESRPPGAVVDPECLLQLHLR